MEEHNAATIRAKIKRILKNLGQNKYYEHIAFIERKLNIPTPLMRIELEEKLCDHFIKIQAPFSKHCPELSLPAGEESVCLIL